MLQASRLAKPGGAGALSRIFQRRMQFLTRNSQYQRPGKATARVFVFAGPEVEVSQPSQTSLPTRESQTGSKVGDGGRNYSWATVRISELQTELGHSKRQCKVGAPVFYAAAAKKRDIQGSLELAAPELAGALRNTASTPSPAA